MDAKRFTVTFDLDGTLLRSPFWRLHMRPWLSNLSHQQGTPLPVLWDLVRQEGDRRWMVGDWVGAFDWPGITETILGQRLPEPTETPRAEDVRALILPYVEETWMELAKIPVRYAVVTNGFYRFQYPYIQALNWHHWLERIITPDRVGTAKPDPGVFASLGPVLCHVGDRPEHDTVAARRAGVIAVQCGSKPKAVERSDRLAVPVSPDIQIADFRALPMIVRQLLASAPVIGVPRKNSREVSRETS